MLDYKKLRTKFDAFIASNPIEKLIELTEEQERLIFEDGYTQVSCFSESITVEKKAVIEISPKGDSSYSSKDNNVDYSLAA